MVSQESQDTRSGCRIQHRFPQTLGMFRATVLQLVPEQIQHLYSLPKYSMECYQTIFYESIFKTLPSNNLTARPFTSISCLPERTNCVSFSPYISWSNYTEYVIFLSTSTPTEFPRLSHNALRRAVFVLWGFFPTVTFCSTKINWANRNHPKTSVKALCAGSRQLQPQPAESAILLIGTKRKEQDAQV